MGEAGRQSGIYGRLNDQARAQNGVFSLAQLLDAGFSRSAVYKRAASGRLHRVHCRVYALVPPALLSRNGRFMAAVLACGPGATLSHRSAAWLLELRATARASIEVTVPGRNSHKHAGIDFHRSLTLTASDITIVNGIPCTTVARTLLDLNAVLARRPVERAIDQAEILEVLDARALEDQLQRNRYSAAAHKLGAILVRHTAGSTPTDRELEERFLALCRRAALPAPGVNVWIDPDDGEPAMRVDFVWRARRLAVETDSRRYHLTRQAFETDRRRDQRLTLAGWRVVRVTWRQITDDPATTGRLVAGLLGQT